MFFLNYIAEDAAINWSDNRVYFFKGNRYTRYTIGNSRPDGGFEEGRDISVWNFPPPLDEGIDGAINWNDNKTFFFKNDRFVRFTIGNSQPDEGYRDGRPILNWNFNKQMAIDPDSLVPLEIPSPRDLPLEIDLMIGAGSAVLGSHFFALLNTSRGIAVALGVCIGLGPELSIGSGGGLSLGAGVIVFPNGRLGLYGSASVVAGLIVSASATWQMTIVKGPRENFVGEVFMVGGGGGEVFVGNGSALLHPETLEFMGVTLGGGVGIGASPAEIYVGMQTTYSLIK